VQINPATIKLTKANDFTETKEIGEQKKQIFDRQNSNSLNFEIIFDDTGVISGKKTLIKEQINKLEKILYSINGESHEPNYAKIVWGDFTFQGRLNSLSYDYNLFRSDGMPLRVKATLSFKGYKKIAEKKSPDLSRIIILKAGENIPLLCEKYYGDASYCVEIARVNKLTNFRNTKAGTKLLFPPLVR
jgi:hypothetical protein